MGAIARAARNASRQVAKASADVRARALQQIAGALRRDTDRILAANAEDVAAAGRAGLSAAMIDRLRLDARRIETMAAAVDEVAGQDDLVGRIERTERRPNGMEVSRMRIPLGVIAIIYESRPNVTTDAAALCLKSGNAAILRGGKEAARSNAELGRIVSAALEQAGLPAAAVQVIASSDREAMRELLAQEAWIDLVIPRGGEGLIRFVAESSRIPVIKHYKGVCHIYVHAAADVEMALSVAENAKVQRPGTCNAVETILVDREIAEQLIPRLCDRLATLGVEVRGDPAAVSLGGVHVRPAAEDDWYAEYLDKIVALRVVRDFDEAVRHIECYGSDHTESIITQDAETAGRFLREVSSSTVMVNASTRLADGGELGLGAEIGISTTRLHAYGPMGVEGLTTTKFVVRGDGQTRT